MHLTLTKKYILSYLLFGIGCFFLISTVTSNLIMKQVVVEKASAFYQEGIYMSDPVSYTHLTLPTIYSV